MLRVLNRLMILVALIVLCSSPAYAYLDPSVMTYTTQAIAGLVVAVGAVIGIYWRRAKRNVQKKLGIDENAKKEVEEDSIQIITDEKK